MKQLLAFSVRRVAWEDSSAELRAVRMAVFVEEQHVPIELEWDGLDESAIHVLAVAADGHAIGTARLLPDHHIGRMAVLERWRRHGVGTALLQELLKVAAQRGDSWVELSAQTHAIGFYRRLGFAAMDDEYLEAGISHRKMRLNHLVM